MCIRSITPPRGATSAGPQRLRYGRRTASLRSWPPRRTCSRTSRLPACSAPLEPWISLKSPLVGRVSRGGPEWPPGGGNQRGLPLLHSAPVRAELVEARGLFTHLLVPPTTPSPLASLPYQTPR